MADFTSSLVVHSPGSAPTGAQAAARERSPRQGMPTALEFPGVDTRAVEHDPETASVIVTEYISQAPETGTGPFWFEHVHCTPESIELGNLVATVVREVEIYNAYRKTSQTLTAAVANAGPGVTLDGVPTLPHEIFQQSGVVFDVVVNIEGPPTIDGTIDVTTDPASFSIPITGSRIIMFAYQPETGITEVLEFRTDILMAADGTEQRVAWRKNPRQLIDMIVRVIDDHDRRKMQNILRGWHHRVFGVPIWWEARTLESDLAIGATSIPIDTAYADYREGGLCIVWSDPDVWDAVEIDTVNANSLDITSGLLNSFTAREALVMPLRTAQMGGQIDMRTFLKNLQDVRLQWTVLDNDVGTGFGDTSPYSTHNSKVLLDDPNVADGPIGDGILRVIESLDNETAARHQFTDQLSSVPVTRKGFYGGTRQAIWEARKLVHALRGSQISFYMPTFLEDLVVTQDLTSSSTDLNIENVGYTSFINGVEPYKSIWIELANGTIITRQVVGSVVIDEDNELLTVSPAWSSDVDKDDIVRVCFLRLVRIADDRVELQHDLPGSAEITMAVRGAP